MKNLTLADLVATSNEACAAESEARANLYDMAAAQAWAASALIPFILFSGQARAARAKAQAHLSAALAWRSVAHGAA